MQSGGVAGVVSTNQTSIPPATQPGVIGTKALEVADISNRKVDTGQNVTEMTKSTVYGKLPSGFSLKIAQRFSGEA